ncbi:beta-class carbonic anhydrase [Tumebacillus permanentifrigoris]|uniref:carbonic anhydrase n=1 Tax=Tumebacillus permanentifrigoris TaxID=378543 RepID=A0A316DFV1_9BACL|nr:carbonic anhydrase [Tumebacillus permanentifrigoris]PWK16422.1 carbonic anhydrase [Tumebacillus permanentifrigoris]
MRIMNEILEFNKDFVEHKEYEKYKTTKFPDKRLVILSCMDTRLSDMLQRALNLRNGDAKIIKNAGGMLTHPFGGIMRSIIVAIYELNANEVCIIGHHGCGMGSINPVNTIEKMKANGVQREVLSTLEYSGVDLERWLHGFDNVEESVRGSVDIVRNHPLIPKNIPVHGLVIDPETGKLDLVVDGYQALEQA